MENHTHEITEVPTAARVVTMALSMITISVPHILSCHYPNITLCHIAVTDYLVSASSSQTFHADSSRLAICLSKAPSGRKDRQFLIV
ncbi:hypothetical protein E4T42_00252 [Aureobasidium subglaciale]|nr:hypothetical protein E4T42_00252 [Aureobasidium subglaciale]